MRNWVLDDLPIEKMLEDEKVIPLTRLSDFFRLCLIVAEQHQYATFSHTISGEEERKVLLDSYTANAVVTVLKAATYPKAIRKLFLLLKKHGPVVFVGLCFKVLENAQSK